MTSQWRNEIFLSPPFSQLSHACEIATMTSWPTVLQINHWLSERHVKNFLGRKIVAVEKVNHKRIRPIIRYADMYEGSVYENGHLWTRPNNWHDLFNALVWLTYPRSKAVLNYRHYHELSKQCPLPIDRLPNGRSKAQDALTLFDEGGGVLLNNNTATPIIFGHGAFETLALGKADFSVGCWKMPLTPDRVGTENIDMMLAEQLGNASFFVSSKELQGLNLLDLFLSQK